MTGWCKLRERSLVGRGPDILIEYEGVMLVGPTAYLNLNEVIV